MYGLAVEKKMNHSECKDGIPVDSKWDILRQQMTVLETDISGKRDESKPLTLQTKWDELIEKHKEAETALRASKERYRAVVEDTPAMICRFWPDGTLTFVNNYFCNYFKREKRYHRSKLFSFFAG